MSSVQSVEKQLKSLKQRGLQKYHTDANLTYNEVLSSLTKQLHTARTQARQNKTGGEASSAAGAAGFATAAATAAVQTVVSVCGTDSSGANLNLQVAISTVAASSATATA